MRLAFIHPFQFRYARGIERYTANLTGALALQGHEVDIITWHWKNRIEWSELSEKVGIRIMPTFPYYSHWAVTPFIVRQLLLGAYDMVYIHFADYGEAFALRLLGLLGKQRPFAIVLHYPYSQVPHRYRSFVRSGLAAQAHQVIAVSQFVADEAQPVLGRSSAVISHGVDVDRFRPDATVREEVRRQLDIPARAPLLLTVSAFEERKGIQWMLRALPHLTGQIPEIRYLIVGAGPYEAKLRELIQALNMQNHVIVQSATPDVARLYQAADLFVIPARGEASSLVSLEAMACELPVLASAHPPFDELIQPAWGWQIEETESTVLASIIAEALRDRNRRTALGRQGRSHILAYHTWPAIAQQYLSLLL